MRTCRYQKVSLWSWLLGSVSSIVQESIQMLDGSLDIQRAVTESDDEWQQRKQALSLAIEKRAIVLIHAVIQVRPPPLGDPVTCPAALPCASNPSHCFPSLAAAVVNGLWGRSGESSCMQALLATGLLQLWPFKPRTTATFGVIASAMNCYMIAPAVQEYVKSLTAPPSKPVWKTA